MKTAKIKPLEILLLYGYQNSVVFSHATDPINTL